MCSATSLTRANFRSLAGLDGIRSAGGSIRALILVPTRELVDQTANAISSLAYYCGDVISVCGLSGGSNAEQAARLSEAPDVVVATPARVVAHLSLNLGAGAGAASSSSSSAADSGLLKSTCETLIIDEADLVLSYGYQEDVRTIVSSLPRICQSMLLSATLSPQLEEMKRLVLHSPAILRLEDGNGSNTSGGPGVLTQLYVRIPRADRYLLVYALLKLRLIAGAYCDVMIEIAIVTFRFHHYPRSFGCDENAIGGGRCCVVLCVGLFVTAVCDDDQCDNGCSCFTTGCVLAAARRIAPHSIREIPPFAFYICRQDFDFHQRYRHVFQAEDRIGAFLNARCCPQC